MTAPDGTGDEGLRLIRETYARATEAGPAEADPDMPVGPDEAGPVDEHDDEGGSGGDERPASRPLPDDCPLVPLGINGRSYHLLDAHKQHQEVPYKDLGRSVIIGLMGDGARDYLRRHWPRKSQDRVTGAWITTGWAPEEVQFDLAEACARKGVWSPRTRLRGAGAWAAPDGALIIHCGDRVYRYPVEGGASAGPPGVIGEHVYPARPASPRPDPDPQPSTAGPGRQLLAILRTWSWSRPEIDPILMLGWIGAAMIGGSLKFRPMIWVTGEHGTGKSTLQDLVKWLFGTTGLLSVASASAAGIAQTLGQDSLPAALDEQEASADSRQVGGVLALAREASTGGVRVKGGADHEARTFIIRSAFLFTSILIPSMEPQDVSRFAVCDLRPLARGSRPPRLDEAEIGALGRRLLRRVVDGWPRLAITLERYRDALTGSGRHSGRGADLYGTLLACADLLLADAAPEQARLDQWAVRLDATNIAELDGAMSDKASCLHYLLTQPLVDQHTKWERTVAEWVGRAAGQYGASDEGAIDANRILAVRGLKMVLVDKYYYLAVANSHQGVARLFADTKWAASAGNAGVWRQSLGRIEGARVGHQVKMPPNCRAVLVPLSAFLPGFTAPPGAGDNGSAAGPAPEPGAYEEGEAVEAQGRSAADAALSSVARGPDPSPEEDPFGLI